MDSVLAQSKWLALPAACFFLAFSSPPADQCVVTFQESGEASDNAQALVGHWRKTTVSYESVKDEHLVFHTDGTVDNWVVTVSGPYGGRTSRTGTTTGHWIVEGKLLQIDCGDKESSRPFFFHKGRLVLPNIPNNRKFCDRVEWRVGQNPSARQSKTIVSRRNSPAC